MGATNWNWQLLGYKTTMLYGDNGEHPTYADAVKAGIEKTLELIESLIVETQKDRFYDFETVLHIASEEEQKERSKKTASFLASIKNGSLKRKRNG
jgi:hypothetical protein